MLTANLLPESEKKRAAFEHYRRLVELFAALAIIVFALASVALLPVYIPLAFEARELKRLHVIETAAFEQLGIAPVIEELRRIKRENNALRTFLAADQRASALAEFLLAPRSVTITSFIADAGGGITLGGFAPTRRDLLDFEKILRDSGRFEEVALPLSNITRETDITFTLKAKLKPDYRL